MRILILLFVLLAQLSCSSGQYVKVADDEVYYISVEGNHRYEAVVYPAGKK